MSNLSAFTTARRRACLTFCTFALMSTAVACGGDAIEDQNAEKRCLFGEMPHPITGLCPEDEVDQGGGGGEDMGVLECPPGERYDSAQGRCFPAIDGDDMGSSSGDMGEAGQDAGQDASMPDQGDGSDDQGGGDQGDERCAMNLDSDDDGMTNDCECTYGTDPYVADTDADGLLDGEEDVNGDCRPLGEPDARVADTDSDGISDFDEIMNSLDPLVRDTDRDGIEDGVEFAGCTDPLVEDSDADGLPDGVEDGNQDGEIGVCANRVYEVMCAAGESDPCEEDTDGDGTLDRDELIYRTCRPSDTQGLTQPQLLIDMQGDYQLAVATSVMASTVTSASGVGVSAHVFEDGAHAYTGFILSMAPPAGLDEAFELSDHVFGAVLGLPAYSSSSRRSAGRQITTHDGFKAMVDATVDLPIDVSPEMVRDELLSALTGLDDLTHTLTHSIPVAAAQSSLLKYEVVARSQQEYVVVVTVAPLGSAQDTTLETGFRSDDLTSGSSVARAMEQLQSDCIMHQVTERAEVDIIIAMDASGSMSEEQEALANFVQDLTAFLNAANLDWRIGVTSVGCSNITQDAALSPEFKALFPAGGGFFDPGPCSFPIGGGSGGNGQLVKTGGGPGFSQDSAQISARINAVDGTNSEFTLTMGVAAVDRALPRSDTDGDKIREDAAVVVIAVTDEEDELFKEEVDFLPKENLTSSERMTLDLTTNPFVEYLLKEEVGATVFGLYNVPNSDCGTAAEFASGIHDIVNKTGGTGGSICQSDITTSLQAIASATAGIASGLRLRGAPVAPSIQVSHAQVMTGMEVSIVRGREDGFDYDGIVNRLTFYGPNPPQTNDRLVVPYLRWSNSILMCQTESDCPGEQKYKCVDGECR